MNLDELRSVQSKERQTDSLQHLRESFYEDVSSYITELEDQRERAADRADDPFADPEVRQLTDEIETANEVVEAIYDRRLGKLVKRASLAAADMPADAEGLTAEEQELFEDLVDRIESNKAHVLDVLEGEAPGGADASGASTDVPSAPPDREDPAARGGTSAAPPEDADPASDAAPRSDPDEPGTDPSLGAGSTDDPVTLGGQGDELGDDRPSSDGRDGEPVPGESAGEPDREEDPQPDGGAASVDVAGLDDRTTVRVTGDVDEFFGVDQREYDLEREDVVTLPAENAEPLLESGDAERVE